MYIHIFICIYIYICNAYTDPRSCIHIYMYIHTYIHTYTHIYIYIQTQDHAAAPINDQIEAKETYYTGKRDVLLSAHLVTGKISETVTAPVHLCYKITW